jgi:hypothetical protein
LGTVFQGGTVQESDCREQDPNLQTAKRFGVRPAEDGALWAAEYGRCSQLTNP